MKPQDGLTVKELCRESNAPFYIVNYLRRLGRLPILFESTGKGDATIFKCEAVDIVLHHINRKKRLNNVEADK